MKGLLALASSRNLRVGLIAVPWLLAAVYLYAFAADRYAAESLVAVRSNGDTPAIGMDSLAMMLGGGRTSSRDDELMLEAHVLSMDMLRALDERLALREAYSAPRFDFIFRLSRDATREQFLEHYRRRTHLVVNETSGLITIRTQAFTPALAEATNREILEISERFINEAGHRIAREQMAFAEQELAKARRAVNAARGALLAFQNEHGVLDPVAQAAGNTGLTLELKSMLARQEAELKTLLAYLNEDSHQAQALRAQIAGTRAQIESESRRAMSSADGTSLNALAGEYQQLSGTLEFALDTYRLALSGVETARVESTRKLKSLVLAQSPTLPQTATYPRRGYTLIALLTGLMLLYGIARLVVATIEDHRE